MEFPEGALVILKCAIGDDDQIEDNAAFILNAWLKFERDNVRRGRTNLEDIAQELFEVWSTLKGRPTTNINSRDCVINAGYIINMGLAASRKAITDSEGEPTS